MGAYFGYKRYGCGRGITLKNHDVMRRILIDIRAQRGATRHPTSTRVSSTSVTTVREPLLSLFLAERDSAHGVAPALCHSVKRLLAARERRHRSSKGAQRSSPRLARYASPYCLRQLEATPPETRLQDH